MKIQLPLMYGGFVDVNQFLDCEAMKFAEIDVTVKINYLFIK